LFGRQIVLVAAGGLRVVAKHAGREAGKAEDVAVEGGHVLNLVAGDGATDVGRGRIERWNIARVNGDRFGCIAEVQLDVECVGLLRDDCDVGQGLAGESLGHDNQAKAVRGKSIEEVNSRAVAGAGLGMSVDHVGKRQRGPWNGCAGGVGYRALDGGPELRVRQHPSEHHCGDWTDDRPRKAADPRRQLHSLCDMRHTSTPRNAVSACFEVLQNRALIYGARISD
jgi:hypothetical protein